jgi:hypothetical protein
MGAAGRGIRVGVSYPSIAGDVVVVMVVAAIALLARLGGLAIDVLE